MSWTDPHNLHIFLLLRHPKAFHEPHNGMLRRAVQGRGITSIQACNTGDAAHYPLFVLPSKSSYRKSSQLERMGDIYIKRSVTVWLGVTPEVRPVLGEL